jgi:hypothetical protein
MKTQTRSKTVLVDGYTRFCLTAIVVLLTMLIVGFWADGVPMARDAGAAEPMRYQPQSAIDTSEMTKVQGQTNEKLDKLIQLLESGTAKVQIVQAAEAGSGGKTSDATPSDTQQTTE